LPGDYRLIGWRGCSGFVSGVEAYPQRLGGFTARERPAFGVRPTLRFVVAGALTLGYVAFAVWFIIDLGLQRARWLRGAQVAGLLVLLVVLGIESFQANTSWSPYYKITATPEKALGGNLKIDVNGVPHQSHQSYEFAPGKGVYQVAKPGNLDDVLVIGSGGGNDVAVALHNGAKHVDAVEIDPELLELGEKNHPDKPYSDPRVTTHVDDGRAFLERTNKKYDLIVLALPDSITLVSGQASADAAFARVVMCPSMTTAQSGRGAPVRRANVRRRGTLRGSGA